MKRDLQSPPQLRLLFWETTIKCNLACAHCRRLGANQTADKDLSANQAADLIKQLAQLGKGQGFMPVLIFSGGEPLCREDLFELVGRANSLGITSALATNGTLIDAKAAQLIKDNSIARVAVSLDGATADVHDRLRRLEGSFEAALAGVSRLRKKKVPFQINVTLTKHNAGRLQDIYELAVSLGAVAVHIFMLVPVGCGQDLAESDMLSPQQCEERMLEICRLEKTGRVQLKVTCGPHYERVIRQQGLPRVHRKPLPIANRKSKIENRKFLRGCLAGLAVLFVSHQGDVFPCGYLPVKCGNVLEEKLADIWRNNKDLTRMRDTDKLEGKCGICDYRRVCGGCRARAYAATGNYMAQEPSCAYVPPAAANPI